MEVFEGIQLLICGNRQLTCLLGGKYGEFAWPRDIILSLACETRLRAAVVAHGVARTGFRLVKAVEIEIEIIAGR